jgi:hypothetical protein
MLTDIQAIGYRALADNRLTGERFGTNGYYNAKANDIIRDLVTNCLTSDGVTLANVPANAGPVIESAEFNYATVTEAFDKIAELAGGYIWDISPTKEMLFYAPTSGPTVLTIAANSANPLAGMTVEETLEQYANKVVVKVGTATSSEAESFDGSHPDQPTDGARQEWNLAKQVFSAPEIEVNGVAKTVGIANVDIGKDWYWQQGSSLIQQDTGATPLPNTATLSITYTAQQSIQVFAQNGTQIAARAAIEGTSGVYERIFEATTPTATSSAQALATQILAIYDEPSYVLKCQVRNLTGVMPGDKITQNRAEFPTGSYVIRAVRFYQVQNEWRRELEAIKGPILQDGFQFWRGLGGSTSGSGASVSGTGGGGSSALPWTVIPYAVSITPNAANKNERVTLTGPITINFPSGAVDGEEYDLAIIQDATGGRIVTFGSGWPMDANLLDARANAVNIISIKFTGASTAYRKGFVIQ